MEREVSPLKVLIERIIKDEIEDMAGEIKSLVKQAVKSSFVSKIRESVRNAISETIEEILPETGKPGIITCSNETQWDKDFPHPSYELVPGDRQGFLTPQKEFVTVHPHIAHDVILSESEESLSPETLRPAQGDSPSERLQEFNTGDGNNSGRYIYCIVESNDRLSLGRIGIGGNEVYTIPYKDLAALVHNCSTEPYASEDSEIVKGWVMTHQEVLERTAQRFSTVIPLGFDTIIKAVNGQTPEQNLIEWLKGDYENLKVKVARLKGKEEYGVQILWNPKIIGQKIAQITPEIKKLDEDIKSKPRGMAYMYKQKLEDALKTELEKAADRYFKEFYEQIKPWAGDLRVEKTKKAEEGKHMLMNLSCLVDKEKYKKLGEELERINNMDGFFVRFTGPWPPYSFV